MAVVVGLVVLMHARNSALLLTGELWYGATSENAKRLL